MRFLKLLFIRHAQSVGNQQKRMQGQAEFELSSEGRHQAEKLAQRLLIEGWCPSYIYTSPLQRTVQTTEILLARLLADPLPSNISDLIDGELDTPIPELATNTPAPDIRIVLDRNTQADTGTDTRSDTRTSTSLDIEAGTSTGTGFGTAAASSPHIGADTGVASDDANSVPRALRLATSTSAKSARIQTFPTREGTITVEYADELQEHQNGIFKGLTWSEARLQYPDLCHALESSPDWIPVPGAESLQTARDRSHQFIQRLLDRHTDGEQIWIVTHSWIMQHLISELMGCDRSWRLHVHNTALFEFWIDRSRWQRTDQNRFNTDLWQIRRFNDYQHLREG